jgi:hypothetical protein
MKAVLANPRKRNPTTKNNKKDNKNMKKMVKGLYTNLFSIILCFVAWLLIFCNASLKFNFLIRSIF